jgi:hemerythrin-like metal-binding protein
MNAEKFTWKLEMSIGNPKIDEEHIKIMNIFNTLVDIHNGIGYHDEFARVLTEMTNYALQHFEKEELYMKQFEYPKIESHIEMHRKYIYKVAMFNVNYRIDTEVDEVLIFINQWWNNHILGADMEYENYRTNQNRAAYY